MKKLLFLLCLTLFGLSMVNGQYQKPPEITHKTIKYELPELIINDSLFMYELDSLIFNSTYNLVSREVDKYLRIFIAEDHISVELSDICGDANPANQGLGYFKRNGLIYIIRGNNNNNLFSATKNKLIFPYKATMFGNADVTEDDLPTWIFEYKDGKLFLKYPN